MPQEEITEPRASRSFRRPAGLHHPIGMSAWIVLGGLSAAAGPAGAQGWHPDAAFVQAGTGDRTSSVSYRSSDRRFTTKLNFQDHVAAGYVWGDHGLHDLGLRFDHYSNAGIRQPNPGVELASIRYTHRF